MKKRTLYLVIVLLALFQATLLNYFRIFNVKPDLLLICAVFVGLVFELKHALLFSLVLGFLKDAFTAQVFAAHIFYFPFLAAVTFFLAKKIPIETTLVRTVLIFLAVILIDLLKKFFQFSAGNYFTLGVYSKVIILESLYTALVSPLIFKVLR
ncbi:MAG: rod shape-determining protein MreD [Candidatus Omnitrophica bacterium]|nr:rod shape-determining protein MreD [Candidatus Omnitrophota bacterium]MDD5653042.1 rod shape-determining protein MreD [Candidatus Omnitrophota bacterium]